METINYQGVQVTRDLEIEKRIKKECKYYNSDRHPSERLNFKTYCEHYYSHLIIKNNKIYSI